MPQIKISNLPLYTGNTTGAYLVMNNSGQTTTYKVTKETLIGASGTSGTSGTSGGTGASGSSGSSGTSGSSGGTGTSGSNGSSGTSGSNGSSGTSGSNGSSGTSGISGSSGTSGDSIFAVTGSVWNTTRNVGVTGSLNINGNTTITGSLNISGSAFSDVNINGRIQVTTPNGTTSIGGNITPNIVLTSGSAGVSISRGNMFLYNNTYDDIEISTTKTTGSAVQILTFDPTNTQRTIVELPCSSSWNGGLTKFKYPVEITGSLKVTEALNTRPLYYGSGSVYSNNFQNVPGTPGDIRIFEGDGGLYNLAFFTVSGSNSWAAL